MKSFVVDASVVLKWYLPDEVGVSQALSLLADFIEGGLSLHAPDLIDYEFLNAMWVAGKMGRIRAEDRDAAVKNFLNIEITKTNIKELFESILAIATEYDRSCYDAAYLALAEVLESPLVTSDKRLYNAVKGKISSVAWIEDI
jgi:predicted nucleic acid-binding protein